MHTVIVHLYKNVINQTIINIEALLEKMSTWVNHFNGFPLDKKIPFIPSVPIPLHGKRKKNSIKGSLEVEI